MYEKRKAIKSQILPDFTAKWLELQNTGHPDLLSVWTVYFDGSKRVEGARAGVVLISPQGHKMRYVFEWVSRMHPTMKQSIRPCCTA
jgi:hypothetical protein